VLLVLQVFRVHPVLVLRGLMVVQVPLVFRVHQDLKAQLVLMVPQVLPEQPAFRVRVVVMDLPGLLELKVLQVLLDLR